MLIFMSHTIEYLVNSIQTKEIVHWATELIKNGEVKSTPTGTKYIVVNTDEV
jgi:hypothetical protein